MKRWTWNGALNAIKSLFRIIIWIIISIVAFYSLRASWRDSQWRAAHEGARCGPNHHWVYVGTPENDDLSCEEDR